MQKAFLYLFLSILYTSSFASELNISYTSKNDLVISGLSCEKLLEAQNAICSWKEKVDKEKVKTLGKCYKNKSGKYSVTVSSCLPKFVKENQHKKNYKSGANCWGTALSFKSLSLRPRFVWQKEITYWMNSPLCRKLEVSEKKMPGDILNMYGPEYVFQEDEASNKGVKFWKALFPGRLKASLGNGYSGYHHLLHSETYLSDEISFGKDSPNLEDRFKFNRTKEIYARPRDERCQERQDLTPYFREYQNPPKNIKGSRCDYFSLAYRCEDIEEFFSKQELTLNEKRILEEIEELKKIQDKLFPLLVSPQKTISPKDLKEMIFRVDKDAEEALILLEREVLDKNHEMLLVYKYFTAQGIRKSLELAELVPATEIR